MMKQTKFWILLFAALAILGCGAFLLLRSHGQTGQTAVIRVDGDVYQRIDLRADQSGSAIQNVGSCPNRGGAQKAPVIIPGGMRILNRLFDILDRD